MAKDIKKITHCRVCKGKTFSKVLTLGPTPLANAFLTKDQIDGPEHFYPLDVYFCNTCTLLQLGHVVSPTLLFKDYVYVSSTSSVFIKHFEDFAKDVSRRFTVKKGALVIDIGSNDGVLLRPFKNLDCHVLGIEPASKIANVARNHGIDSIDSFFSPALASKIVKKIGKAKIVTATNVFAHIDDLDEVIKGLQILLADDGVFIIESPYLVDFLENRYFDLVYHEHLSYWAVKPLTLLFQRFDMEVFDVQKVSSHGGSIRVFVQKAKGSLKRESAVLRFLTLEKEKALDKIETYRSFESNVLENKAKLISMLTKLKRGGARIAGYGASAKGNTLLNFFGIGQEYLDYIVDDSPWKQELYSPGTRIPVISSKVMYDDTVDYLILLAWNFADSIIAMHQKFKKRGGSFIIPVPIPKII